MCDFISWIEKDGDALFLDNDDLKTRRGRELKEYLGVAFDEDKKGHGAIKWFYNLSSGCEHMESEDFSSPNNFHPKVVDAIKSGKLSLFGCPKEPKNMLNKTGMKMLERDQKEYADWQKAYADLHKADADLHKAYADRQKAYADLHKAYADRQKAYADLHKADADLHKAYADLHKAYADRQKAYADLHKADADLHKADADWKKADAKIFWSVFSDKKYRVKCWK